MAQVTSQSVANGSGAAVRSDINTKLAALFSASSGAAAPATSVAGQVWYDTVSDQLFVRNAANTTWEGLFSGTAAEVRTALGLVIGTNVQPFDANILKANAAAVLTAAVTATPEDAGTKASGNYTPSPVGGNFKKYINGGAHTLAAPTFAGNYTAVIQVTNSASAGAITFSGFAKVIGDVLTTTNAQLFQIGLTKTDGGVIATVVAMQ
jgi:hypothetical protein